MHKDMRTEEEASCESFALTQIYTGIVLTLSTTILLMISSFFVVVSIGIFEIGIETVFSFSGSRGQSISNTLEVLFLAGWLPVLSGIKKLDIESGRINSVTLLYWCNILLVFAALFDYFGIFNVFPELFFRAHTGIQIITVLPTLAIYPLQLAVIRKIAKQVGNAKVEKQTHIWVWVTPMLLAASITSIITIHQNFFWILIVVLLTIAIQYWNMLEFLRRDIKCILLSSTEPLLSSQELP